MEYYRFSKKKKNIRRLKFLIKKRYSKRFLNISMSFIHSITTFYEENIFLGKHFHLYIMQTEGGSFRDTHLADNF